MTGRKVKRYIIPMLGLILLCAFLVIFRKEIAIKVAGSRLEKTFTESAVSIRECRQFSARSLEFSNIEISRKGYYDLSVKDVKIEYSPLDILSGRIKGIFVNGALAVIDKGGADPKSLSGWLDLSGGGLFRLDKAVISEGRFFAVMKNFACEGSLSLVFSLKDRAVEEIDLAMPVIKAYGASLKGLSVKGAPADGAEISVREIAFRDLLLTGGRGTVRITDSLLLIKPFEARILDGVIRGAADLAFGRGGFSLDLDADAIDMARFVEDFKLAEKVELTGRLSGNASLTGDALRVSGISGEFSTNEPGGVLIIKDTRFLENMAKGSGQSLDLLLETFRNYQYTIGTISIALDEKDLRMEVALNGDAGRRDFDIVIHDFITK